MTDRELLELAAKAADIGPLDFDYAERESHGMYFGPRLPMPQGVMMAAMWTYWRPLEESGDRLNLIRTLRMGICFDDCTVWKRLPNGDLIQEWWGGDSGDEAHAVLRVAAEIGKGVQP